MMQWDQNLLLTNQIIHSRMILLAAHQQRPEEQIRSELQPEELLLPTIHSVPQQAVRHRPVATHLEPPQLQQAIRLEAVTPCPQLAEQIRLAGALLQLEAQLPVELIHSAAEHQQAEPLLRVVLTRLAEIRLAEAPHPTMNPCQAVRRCRVPIHLVVTRSNSGFTSS